MVVVGKKECIIQLSGKFSDVQKISNECSNMVKVPIIDAVLTYNCTRTMKTYLLIRRNTLYSHSMEKNLMPLFLMRESGIFVNYVAKIHYGEYVSHESHSVIETE